MPVNNRINVGIVGVGNCASALMQGIHFYSNNENGDVGLRTRRLFGYKISDIDIVCAFDCDENKVGLPLDEAIWARPNCCRVFSRPSQSPCIVHPGRFLDGFVQSQSPQKTNIKESDFETIVNQMRESAVEILINYLPVGSNKASEFYAECALAAGASFVNAMPSPLAILDQWQRRFDERELVLLGDDIKAQIGATIVHRQLVALFNARGASITKTYQLNTGGNADFENMLNQDRLKTKLASKKASIDSAYHAPIPNSYSGPAAKVEHLNDTKIAFINLTGEGFGGNRVSIDLKLEVEDSPNSAGVMVDLIRGAHHLRHSNKDPSLMAALNAYGFKNPQFPMADAEAWAILQEYEDD